MLKLNKFKNKEQKETWKTLLNSSIPSIVDNTQVQQTSKIEELIDKHHTLNKNIIVQGMMNHFKKHIEKIMKPLDDKRTVMEARHKDTAQAMPKQCKSSEEAVTEQKMDNSLEINTGGTSGSGKYR